MTDLHSNVDDWLAKQGFPLEFLTARTFAAHGLPSFQGRFIRDPHTQQPREIDVIASLHYEAKDVLCRTSVVAECKWSRDKPWVLFTGDAASSREEQAVQVIASSFGEGVLWHLSSDPTVQSYCERRRTTRIAFGGRQAFTDKKNNRDHFYEAIQSVVGAALSFATAADPPIDQIAKTDPMLAHLVYPVIVVDAPIFQAFLRGSELCTEQVSHGTVLWHGHESHQSPVLVDVVASDSLDPYARELSAHCRELAAYIQNPAREVRFALQSGIRSELVKKTRSFVPIPRVLKAVLAGL